jgi:hypothetical protein
MSTILSVVATSSSFSRAGLRIMTEPTLVAPTKPHRWASRDDAGGYLSLGGA